MHKFSKNLDASSKYLGPDVYKRSKVHTEVQQSWSDLYVTAIRRLLLAVNYYKFLCVEEKKL